MGRCCPYKITALFFFFFRYDAQSQGGSPTPTAWPAATPPYVVAGRRHIKQNRRCPRIGLYPPISAHDTIWFRLLLIGPPAVNCLLLPPCLCLPRSFSRVVLFSKRLDVSPHVILKRSLFLLCVHVSTVCVVDSKADTARQVLFVCPSSPSLGPLLLIIMDLDRFS